MKETGQYVVTMRWLMEWQLTFALCARESGTRGSIANSRSESMIDYVCEVGSGLIAKISC